VGESQFEIIRDAVTPGAVTTGTLLVEGEPFCKTLELPWKDNAPNVSCIPQGTYEVVLLPSARWGKPMPHIQNVPGRSEIEIHIGNFERDTDGCVLLGTRVVAETLIGSRVAFDKFMEWFNSCGGSATVTIQESDPLPLQMQTT
jgi:hypothetical protein